MPTRTTLFAFLLPIVVLDAPSNLGLRPPAPGVEPGARKLPGALRKTGLVERLGARDAGRVEPPAYSPEPDLAVGFRNGTALRRYTGQLAERLEPLFAERSFVVVFGGDCSVLLGAGLALKGRGRYGLAFVDGHDDFSMIRDRSKYEGRFTAAGLDLYLSTGHGPAALSDLKGRSPYFRPSDVVQIGRSLMEEDRALYAFETFDRSGIHAIPIEEIARIGAEAAGAQARKQLEAMETEGFWIHLDADVLDASVMPAVDSPNERGLRFEQLRTILAALLASPKAVGLEITILDPDLDPQGTYVERFARTIEQAFRESGRIPAESAGHGAR